MSELSEIIIDDDLALQQVELSQADDLFHLVDNNREHLGAWLPWVKDNTTVEHSQDFIKGIHEKSKKGEEYGFGIFYKAQLIGHMSLMHVTDKQEPEIGYWISENASGQGIVTKATNALTCFGFDTLNLDTITIRAEPKNVASNRVAEKLGYKKDKQMIHERDDVLMNVWRMDRDDKN